MSELRFEDYEFELEREVPVLDAAGEVEDYEYSCVTLFISGNYDEGEAPSWGYYGGCPGTPSGVEIFSIEVVNAEGEYVKWDGELDADEKKRVYEDLIEQAAKEIEFLKMDIAVARAGLD